MTDQSLVTMAPMHNYSPVDGDPTDMENTGVLPPCVCGRLPADDVHATAESIALNYRIAVKTALQLIADGKSEIARGALTGAVSAHEHAERLWRAP